MSNDILARLEPIFELINQQLHDNFASEIPFITQVCRYTLLGGGKRLRPALFVLAARLCGYGGDKDYYFSTTFEYTHAASLLHDDVVDESDTRRGREATHVVYGNQAAVLVGDFLLAKATAQALETGLPGFIDILAEVATAMSEGEILQLLHVLDTEVTEEEYERVIYRKTASLIQACCRLGAVLAGAPQAWEDALGQYGHNLGLAFQIIDDTLDYSGTMDEFGKPTGQDLNEGKITLPLILTLNRADKADKELLLRLILQDERDAAEFEQIKALIDRYRGLEDAVKKAESLKNSARTSLSIFPDSPTRTLLLDLSDFIITRRR